MSEPFMPTTDGYFSRQVKVSDSSPVRSYPPVVEENFRDLMIGVCACQLSFLPHSYQSKSTEHNTKHSLPIAIRVAVLNLF